MTALPASVLILTNHLATGGAEVYCLTVSQWLAERGVEVILAAEHGELAEQIDPKVRFHQAPLKDVRWSLPKAVSEVRELVKTYQPQIILCNSLATSVIGRLASAPERTPVVTVAHGWPRDRYKLVSAPHALATRVVAVSEDVGGHLNRHGLPKNKITVVPNGINMGPFNDDSQDRRALGREKLGLEPSDIAMINVGRFEPLKAQHHVVEVARRLTPMHPNLKFFLVGYGSREQELRQLIASHGLEENVKILIKRPDVPDLLFGADIYLCTSDWEGMPLAMIEAMASGLPIVSSAAEGITALVRPENGLICTLHDIEALTAGVKTLVEDPQKRASLASGSRNLAFSEFSHEVMCSRLARVLSQESAARR